MHKLLQKVALIGAVSFAAAFTPDASARPHCEFTVECTVIVFLGLPIYMCTGSMTCETVPDGPEE